MITSLRDALRPRYHTTIRKPLYTVLPPILKHLPISSAVFGPPKGVVSSTKEWVKGYTASGRKPDAYYIKVHNEQYNHRIAPTTTNPELDPVFQELDTVTHETFVAKIPQGRALNFDGSIITPDDYLLEDVSPEFDWERYIRGRHTIMSQVRLPKMSTFPGRVVTLMTLAQSFFGHWMMDLLPRIELLKQAGFKLDEIDWFYVDECRHPYQRETLEKLGVSISKVIDPKAYPHICADELIVPSYVGGCFAASRQTCDFLNQTFLEECAELTSSSHAGKRLYISRANTKHRRLLNEAEIVGILQSYGFTVVEPQNMTLEEQARLFRQAEVIVASLGSAVANFVYCQPGAKIIEFFNPRCVQTCTWNVCHQRQCEYYYLLAEGNNVEEHAIREDIRLNPNLLAETLAIADVKPCLTRLLSF